MPPSTQLPGSNQGSYATSQHGSGQRLKPMDDVVDYLKTYARQRPGTAALWCFGLGFIVGWRLKPW